MGGRACLFSATRLDGTRLSMDESKWILEAREPLVLANIVNTL
jgi:hypothetical protein